LVEHGSQDAIGNKCTNMRLGESWPNIRENPWSLFLWFCSWDGMVIGHSTPTC